MARTHSKLPVTDEAKAIVRGDVPLPNVEVRSDDHPIVEGQPWPKPLSDVALRGLVGDVIMALRPNSEADEAALLFQFLAAFGSIVGRGPYWSVEDTRHYTNLFVAIVGDTAKARKGTSLDRVQALMRGMEPEWERRVQTGLSSGEGLIWAVRDPIIEMVVVKDRGLPNRYEEEQTDAGEPDKRLFVVESEFASVLGTCERQGSTLSPVLRNAWDGKRLGMLTKAKSAKCAEPHITVVAHVTQTELERMLTDTAMSNGFANRFLFVCAHRSKYLPFGGGAIDWTKIQIDLRSAIMAARRLSEVSMDAEARLLWESVYRRISEPSSNGLYASVTNRSEAQARRLALLYALLDESHIVRLKHLQAGLEAWRYSEDSSRFLFGAALGDPVADGIMTALQSRPEGMTRTDLYNHFHTHKKSKDIARALQTLQRMGKVRVEREDTDGRTAERWFRL